MIYLLSYPFLLTGKGKRMRLPFLGEPQWVEVRLLLRYWIWLGTPRGIIETWRTDFMRTSSLYVCGPTCQPAVRRGHPPKHWPSALLLHFRCLNRNRASTTDPHRDIYDLFKINNIIPILNTFVQLI